MNNQNQKTTRKKHIHIPKTFRINYSLGSFDAKRGFTLIELLVVIAIIGILMTVVLVGVNSARNKAKVANIQSSLKNVQVAGEIYHNENKSYMDICGQVDISGSGESKTVTYSNSPLQEHFDAILDLDSSVRIGCWVAQTPKIGHGNQSGQVWDLNNNNVGFNTGEVSPNYPLSLGRQDWALVVYFHGNNYAVSPKGVSRFDINNAPGGKANYQDANERCSNISGRLPSPSELRALRMTHRDDPPSSTASQGNFYFGSQSGSFTGDYWTAIDIDPYGNAAWLVSPRNGSMLALFKYHPASVRCMITIS